MQSLYSQLSTKLATPSAKPAAPSAGTGGAGTATAGKAGSQASQAAVPSQSSGGSSPYPYPDSSTTTTFAPAATATTSPSLNESTCPPPAPGGDYGQDSIYAAQLAEVTDIFDNVDTLVTLVDSRTTAIDNEEQLLYALVEERDTLILNKIGAIQASLNLELTFTIEEDLLQGSNGAVADFEVPTSDGGYLNAVPIGVQEIVTTALADEQHAGQPVNPAAPGELAAANAALAAGNYKQAFDDYGTTYTEIVG